MTKKKPVDVVTEQADLKKSHDIYRLFQSICLHEKQKTQLSFNYKFCLFVDFSFCHLFQFCINLEDNQIFFFNSNISKFSLTSSNYMVGKSSSQ